MRIRNVSVHFTGWKVTDFSAECSRITQKTFNKHFKRFLLNKYPKLTQFTVQIMLHRLHTCFFFRSVQGLKKQEKFTYEQFLQCKPVEIESFICQEKQGKINKYNNKYNTCGLNILKQLEKNKHFQNVRAKLLFVSQSIG